MASGNDGKAGDALAFNLWLAWKAYRMGVTLAYLERLHRNDAEPPGPYWVDKANNIDREMTAIISARLQGLSPLDDLTDAEPGKVN
jgi:hypothetical protein